MNTHDPASQFPRPLIELYCLGSFRLLIDGRPCSHLLSYDKVKLLLALLVLAQGRPISRSRIAAMLWPESDPSQGRARVRHALHVLRQALAPCAEALHSTNQELTLAPSDIWCDILQISADAVTDASSARHKLELCQGPFLHGISLPASEELQNWQNNWISQTDLELAQCRHILSNELIAGEHYKIALTHAKTWVSLWPEDESCHRLLIRVLLLEQNRDAALIAFQQCADVLQQRLGVQPDAQTRALLGIETTQSAAPTPASCAVYHYRAMATLAVSIDWKAHADSDPHSLDVDHETSTQLLRTCHDLVLRCARAHDAWIEQEHSTTLLLHFGYPNITERPIAQALDLARALSGLERRTEICLGLAVHADALPIDPANPMNAHHLLCQPAISLAWQADNGSILLSPQAAARLSSWPLEPRSTDAGGTSYQLRLSEIARPGAGRIHGRMREFNILLQYWSGRLTAMPRLLLLQGHAGLGKTKLLQALQDYAHNVEGKVLALEAHEHDARTAYAPLLRWLRKELGRTVTDVETGHQRQQDERLQERLEIQYALNPAQSAVLRQALSEPAVSLSEQSRACLQQALLNVIKTRCRHQTVLLTWENLHWCDQASLQWLQQALHSGIDQLRIVATSRQGLPPSWPGLALAIDKLATPDISELINQRSRSVRLPREIRTQIIEASDGNPLVACELLHLYQLGHSLELIPRLLDRCAAQLRGLPIQQRELLYLACLLPAINAPLASQLLKHAEPVTQAALQTLQQEAWLEFDLQFQLRCPVVLAACLRQLMSQPERQRLGRIVADGLSTQNQTPAVIASLLEQVRYPDTAQWWQRAIEQALEQGQLDQAQDHLTQALKTQRFMTDPARRSQSGLELRLLKATLSTATSGPASESSLQAFAQISALRQTDKPATLMLSLWGEWLTQHNQGQLTASLPLAEQMLELARRHQDDSWEGWAWYALAQHHLWRGDPAKGEALLIRALPLIGRSEQATDMQAPPDNKPSQALAYAALGLCQALQGRFGTGLQNARHAMTLANHQRHPLVGIAARLHLMRIHYLAGNLAEMTQESMCLSHANRVSLGQAGAGSIWTAFMQLHQMLSATLLNADVDLLTHMADALECVRQNMPAALGGQLCMMARALIHVQRDEHALALLNEADQLQELQGSVLITPEIHCLRGDLWLQRERPDLARQHWLQAQASSRQHGLLAYDDWLNERLTPVQA